MESLFIFANVSVGWLFIDGVGSKLQIKSKTVLCTSVPCCTYGLHEDMGV